MTTGLHVPGAARRVPGLSARRAGSRMSRPDPVICKETIG